MVTKTDKQVIMKGYNEIMSSHTSIFLEMKIDCMGTGEITQQLRALVALLEDPG
jgi:hypothetical protein